MAKLLLSYRQENDSIHPNHGAQVRKLAETLRAAKLEVVFDQFYKEAHPGGPDEQWPKWCETQVPNADKVLMVASAGYFRCYDQTELPSIGLGAACETTVIRNTLYECHYISDKFRFVYFDKAHLTGLPIALKGMQQFDANNPDDMRDLIAWAGGTIPIGIVTAASMPMPNVSWPAVLTAYEPDLANRGDEFTFFKTMLGGTTLEHTIIFEAPSNHGKTGLIAECRKYAHRILPSNACVTVDFKVNPSKEDAVDTLRLDLAGLLPTFCRSNGTIGDLRQDLRSLASPILFFFDTYEKSSSEARELVNILLADLEKCPALRIVIAGQNVPDHSKTLWSSNVRYFALGPIKNTKYWSSYASRHYPKLTPDHIEAITSISGGVPGTQVVNFMAVLTNLPIP